MALLRCTLCSGATTNKEKYIESRFRFHARQALVWALLLIFIVGIIPAASAQEGDTIKVGLLHSLSGTMSISETTVRELGTNGD